MTVRARNVRSWLTRTTAAGRAVTHRSRRSRPSRSRSFVGSSSRKTSKRASSSAGERRPGRLAARQRGRRLVEQPVGEAEVGPHLSDACVEVGAAEGEPALQSDRVALVGTGLAGGEGGGRGVHLDGRRRHPGATGEELADRLVRARRLLGQVADGRRRRGALDAAPLGRDQPGERLQQRRLADTVRADDTDAPAGGHDEVDGVEHGERPAGDGQVAGAERGGSRHGGTPRETKGMGRRQCVPSIGPACRHRDTHPRRSHGPSASTACSSDSRRIRLPASYVR